MLFKPFTLQDYMSFETTLGNKDWLNQNETALRELFPETWTHMQNMQLLPILFKLKCLGVDWRNEHEIPDLLNFFKEAKIYLMQDEQIKRNNKHLEFEMVYKPKDDKRTVGDAVKATTEEKDDDEGSDANPLKPLLVFMLFFGWIGGFVLANGFWSTLFCLCPLWAYYLVVERLFQIWGMLPL